ncbi:hypothetical protein ANTPLA_LOCUS9233 [Anthophora plagiata]
MGNGGGKSKTHRGGGGQGEEEETVGNRWNRRTSVVNDWRTNRGRLRPDTADTASGKDHCSVTEDARREKETVDNACLGRELSTRNSFLFTFLVLALCIIQGEEFPRGGESWSLDSVNGTGRIHGGFKKRARGAPVSYTASGHATR